METGDSKAPTESAKSLYIIKSTPAALLNAENWLKGKGWIIDSTTQAREALSAIVQKRPKFIMVCMDHPNAKVRMLPKLFESAFNTKVIVFLEKSTPSSVAMVAGCEYILYPPVSGPAIDRMCSKIESDFRRANETSEQKEKLQKASLGTTDDGMIAIKGSANLSPEHTHIQQQQQQQAAKQAQEAIKALLKGDIDKPEDGDSSIKSSGSASSQSPAEMASRSAMQSGAGSGTAMNVKEGSPGAPSSQSDSSHSSKKTPKDGGWAPVEGAEKKEKKQTKYESADAKNSQSLSSVEEGAKSKPSVSVVAESGASTRRGNSAEGSSGPLGGKAQGKAIMRDDFLRPGENDKLDQGLIASTQEAIDIAAVANLESRILSLTECSQVMCFPIGTSQKHGYILCAIASSPEPLEEFVPIFRSKLMELMTGIDKHFMAGDPMLLNLQSVGFQAWSEKQAHFFKKFVHLDRECAVAYFDEEMPEPTFTPESKHPNMLAIDFQVVKSERRLEFDFFLHFPRNAKFVRYGKRGYKISEAQKNRLANGGVNMVHMPEDHRAELFRYRLQVFFDHKISVFKESMMKVG